MLEWPDALPVAKPTVSKFVLKWWSKWKSS